MVDPLTTGLAAAVAKAVLDRLWAPEDETSLPEPIGIVDERFVVDEAPQPPTPFDNRKGKTPYSVKKTFTAEWAQTYEVGREEQVATRAGAGLGASGVKLEFAAEEAIKAAYRLTEERREARSDEVTFEVPPGVCREVRVVHRREWHEGVVRFQVEGDEVDIPFRILKNVEIGYRVEDRSEP